MLAAARDINPGSHLEAADLRVVRLGLVDEFPAISPASRANLLGRRATTRIPAGSLLHPEQLAPASSLRSGEAVVGALLAPGDIPVANLRAGDRVRLVAAADTTAPTGRAGPLGEATVYAVEPATQGGGWVVSLVVADDAADAVAAAASAKQLRLVLVT